MEVVEVSKLCRMADTIILGCYLGISVRSQTRSGLSMTRSSDWI